MLHRRDGGGCGCGCGGGGGDDDDDAGDEGTRKSCNTSMDLSRVPPPIFTSPNPFPSLQQTMLWLCDVWCVTRPFICRNPAHARGWPCAAAIVQDLSLQDARN